MSEAENPAAQLLCVLGAGFTRAFVPTAPLMIDDYGIDDLLERFRTFHHAAKILRTSRLADGRVDVEALLTRLDGCMPYDFDRGADSELTSLFGAVRDRLTDKITQSQSSVDRVTELERFAAMCVQRRISCITFNYDDVLDQRLWRFRGLTRIQRQDIDYWHPDGGYGFFCPPSSYCVDRQVLSMDKTSMQLLKLHGSLNWRVRRGYNRPLPVDAIVHHEDWYPGEASAEQISGHLEALPLVVPPVLLKAELVAQPVMRLVWSKAYEALRKAASIVFLGYSMPSTDIAARFLFSEAIGRDRVGIIQVVGLAEDEAAQGRFRQGYEVAFPNIRAAQFRYDGVLQWLSTLDPVNPAV